MSILQHIGSLAQYMVDKPSIRKPLSKLGALRISRQEAIEIAQSSIAPNNYCIVVVKVEDKASTKMGYILHEDLGNTAYSTWLDQVKAMP
eukprot:12836717-Heterocapsa_arctica.AAC.1